MEHIDAIAADMDALLAGLAHVDPETTTRIEDLRMRYSRCKQEEPEASEGAKADSRDEEIAYLRDRVAQQAARISELTTAPKVTPGLPDAVGQGTTPEPPNAPQTPG